MNNLIPAAKFEPGPNRFDEEQHKRAKDPALLRQTQQADAFRQSPHAAYRDE